MPKKIDVSVSSLIDLKAELFRKNEAKKQKEKGSSSISSAKSTSTSADLVFARSFATGKKSFVSKDKLARPNELGKKTVKGPSPEQEEEVRRLQASKSRLEEKARIYERMSRGEQLYGDERNEDARLLVNFNQKIREEETLNDSDPEMAPKPGEKWVEFTDSLGRTRQCMEKDLSSFRKADETFKERISTTSVAGEMSVTGTSLEMLSDSMKAELERQKWELEEVNRGPVHYQHISHDEPREHGVAYMAFSRDETLRQEQMKELDQRRKQTIENRNRNERLKGKRKEIMAARLAKVRERKKLKLEDGKEDPLLASSSDEEEIDPSVIPLPEECQTEEAEKKRLEEAERAKKRMEHVRPWDKEKKIMSQETWVQNKREERPQEFAPPSSYF